MNTKVTVSGKIGKTFNDLKPGDFFTYSANDNICLRIKDGLVSSNMCKINAIEIATGRYLSCDNISVILVEDARVHYTAKTEDNFASLAIGDYFREPGGQEGLLYKKIEVIRSDKVKWNAIIINHSNFALFFDATIVEKAEEIEINIVK